MLKSKVKYNQEKIAFIKVLQNETNYTRREWLYLFSKWGLLYLLIGVFFSVTTVWLLLPSLVTFPLALNIFVSFILINVLMTGYIQFIRFLYLPQEITDDALDFYLIRAEYQVARGN